MFSVKQSQELKAKLQDPLWYAKNVLKVETLTDEQIRTIISVRNNKFTAVTSSPGCGKTFDAAIVVLSFLAIPGTVVVTTAPTYHQVVNLLWGEIRKLYNRANDHFVISNGSQTMRGIGGKLNLDELKLSDKIKWYAIGLTASPGKEETVAENIKGYHGDFRTIVVIDEATGVHAKIWKSVKLMAVGLYDRVLAIANASLNNCEFKNFCDDPRTNVIEISALNHPNVKAKQTVITGGSIVSHVWVEEVIQEHCKEVAVHNPEKNTFEYGGKIWLPDPDAVWMILGKFPPESSSYFFYMLKKEIHGSYTIPEKTTPMRCMIDYGNVSVAYFGTMDNEKKKYIFDEWYEDVQFQELESRAESFRDFCYSKGYKDFICICDTDMFAKPSNLYTKGQPVYKTYQKICNAPREGFPKGLNITFVCITKKVPAITAKSIDKNKGFRVYRNIIVREGLSWNKDLQGNTLKDPTIFVSGTCTKFWETVPKLPPSKINPNEDFEQVDDHCAEAFENLVINLDVPFEMTEAERQKALADTRSASNNRPY
jgi:hypothetical protein